MADVGGGGRQGRIQQTWEEGGWGVTHQAWEEEARGIVRQAWEKEGGRGGKVVGMITKKRSELCRDSHDCVTFPHTTLTSSSGTHHCSHTHITRMHILEELEWVVGQESCHEHCPHSNGKQQDGARVETRDGRNVGTQVDSRGVGQPGL